MAKDVDEPHGNRQQRISGVAVAAAASASMATVAGAVILGTAIVLSPALASCSAEMRLLRQSRRQYALCGDQRADHRRRPVMQRRMNGRSAPPAPAALIQELHNLVENDRYPFSPRIRTRRAIRAKLGPEPAREPLPPLKVYAPPRGSLARRRRARLGEAQTAGDQS